MSKRKPRKPSLRVLQTEALSLLEFAIAEAYARGTELHYRLKVPYGPTKPSDGMEREISLLIDFKISFDGDLSPPKQNETLIVHKSTKIRH